MNKLSFLHRAFISLVYLISKTWRIRLVGNFPNGNKGIIVFWHTFMMPCWKLFSHANSFGVVSLSKDGEILSSVLKKMGINLIRGSSSKNSKEVLNELINYADKGFLLITPDGPRGPIYKFKAGAAITSFRTGIPIYLLGVKIHNFIEFKKSWDKFRFPLPFSKTTINLLGPFYFSSELSREEISMKIEELQKILIKESDIA